MMDVQSFLSPTQWAASPIEWFDADWSVRRYARITNKNNESAILLQSPPDHSPDAMVGHLIGEWSKVNRHFQSLGLNVPSILAEDLENGFILMSDFGTDTLPINDKDAYLKATNILITMRDHPQALSFPLKKYEDTHVYKALRFYPQYISKSIEQEWFDAWNAIEKDLPACPRALTHIDFAPQNLMWDNAVIGIIDFQAACDGPFVYDIVNLLEDIRRDVPDHIKQSCTDLYCATLSPKDRDIFNKWYNVITAQFYARILGQIQYLAQEKERSDLMVYYPSITKRFEKLIKNDYLEPVQRIIEKNNND